MRRSGFSGRVYGAGTTCIQSSELMGFEMGQDAETIEFEPQRPIHDHSETGPMDD